MKKRLIKWLAIALGLYGLACLLLYFFQEKLIFFPQTLDKNFRFEFEQKFEEVTIITEDHHKLNGLLFKADSAKGLVFYLHGNAGNLQSWGEVASTYTDLQYDLFMLDYRGFGKSEGEIVGEQQLFQDNQTAYNELKKFYSEDNILVVGYSIGTGLAAKLASSNKPKKLILQAPYYSLIDLMKHTYRIVPVFLLRYPFETNLYLKTCQMPIFLFHGDRDEVIYFESSLKLKEEIGDRVRMITLSGQGHNGMNENAQYKAALKEILNR